MSRPCERPQRRVTVKPKAPKGAIFKPFDCVKQLVKGWPFTALFALPSWLENSALRCIAIIQRRPSSKAIIGLTGGIGSGKSFVASLFEELGVRVVDADIVAREVVEPGEPALEAIKQHFGSPDITLNDGSLNRAKLREMIFNNLEEKQWLENLLHPIIRERIVDQLNSADGHYALLSSPLLLETDQKDLCGQIIVVDIEEEQQVERASLRDANSKELIRKIMQTQIKRDKRLSYADFVIDNSGGRENTRNQVTQLHQELSKV